MHTSKINTLASAAMGLSAGLLGCSEYNISSEGILWTELSRQDGTVKSVEHLDDSVSIEIDIRGEPDVTVRMNQSSYDDIGGLDPLDGVILLSKNVTEYDYSSEAAVEHTEVGQKRYHTAENNKSVTYKSYEIYKRTQLAAEPQPDKD